jgi:hypothetical protein
VVLYGSVQRCRDGLTVGHPELEEHIQRIMPLADQYAFRSADYFDPKEVMKVSQILHVERCCEFALHTADFVEIGTGDDEIIGV